MVIDSLALIVSDENSCHLMFIVFAKLILSFLHSVFIEHLPHLLCACCEHWGCNAEDTLRFPGVCKLQDLEIQRKIDYRTMRRPKEGHIKSGWRLMLWEGPQGWHANNFLQLYEEYHLYDWKGKTRLSGWESEKDIFLFN